MSDRVCSVLEPAAASHVAAARIMGGDVPSIDPDERARLVRPLGVACPTCGADVIRNYCRSCDEFFDVCNCAARLVAHAGHRLYVWTERGILAIPDFDRFT